VQWQERKTNEKELRKDGRKEERLGNADVTSNYYLYQISKERQLMVKLVI
jgi:hypothetical protein